MSQIVPPSDLAAEGVVLSACILDAACVDEVAAILRPEHLHSPANKSILEAVYELSDSGRSVDLVSVAGWLREHDKLQSVGGLEYLTLVTDATPAVGNVLEHAQTVRAKWRLRSLINVAARIRLAAEENPTDAQSCLDWAERSVFELADGSTASGPEHVGPIASRAYKAAMQAASGGRTVTGTTTGFVELDGLTSGMHAGELWIIAGRPGQGKSSLLRDMSVRVARTGGEVVLFELEMTADQTGLCLVASWARADLFRIRTGRFHEWPSLVSASNEIAELPLYVDDSASLSVLDVRARARRVAANARRNGRPLAMIGIDYLQLLQGTRGQPREQVIAEISRGLKRLAKELEVPVVALSQLNRAVESRTDRRPQMSDLRESGQIEQDADVIVFVYRDEYYTKSKCQDPGVAELIIAKQRNGPPGTIRLHFEAESLRFDNLAVEEFDDFVGEFQNGI